MAKPKMAKDEKRKQQVLLVVLTGGEGKFGNTYISVRG